MQLEAFDFKPSRACLERRLDFEVRLRAAIAHTSAVKDVAAHTLVECLDADACAKPSGERTKFEAWMETCQEAVRTSGADEDFFAHHLLKYPDQPMPTWALTEVLSFGKLPSLFELMQVPDAREVAREFGFVHPRRFGAVLRMMVDFRNTCAHGSRLYNRVFKRTLSIRTHDTTGDLLEHLVAPEFTATPKPLQRLYIYVATLAFMLASYSSGSGWNMTFKTQVKKLDIPLQTSDGSRLISPEISMGFPLNWTALDLWQPKRQ